MAMLSASIVPSHSFSTNHSCYSRPCSCLPLNSLPIHSIVMNLSRMSLTQAGEYLCQRANDDGVSDLAHELAKLFWAYKDLDITMGTINTFEFYRGHIRSSDRLKTAIQHQILEPIHEIIPLPLYYKRESPESKRLEKQSSKMVKPPAPLATRPYLVTPVKNAENCDTVQEHGNSSLESSGSTGFSAPPSIFSSVSRPDTPNSVTSSPLYGARYACFEAKLLAQQEVSQPVTKRRSFSSSKHPISMNLGSIAEGSVYMAPVLQSPTHLHGDDVFGASSSSDSLTTPILSVRPDSPSSEYSRGPNDDDTTSSFPISTAAYQSLLSKEYALLVSEICAECVDEPATSPNTLNVPTPPKTPTLAQSSSPADFPSSPTPSRTSFMDKEISISFSVNGLMRSASLRAKKASNAVIHGAPFKGHKRSASVTVENTQYTTTSDDPVSGHKRSISAATQQAAHSVTDHPTPSHRKRLCSNNKRVATDSSPVSNDPQTPKAAETEPKTEPKTETLDEEALDAIYAAELAACLDDSPRRPDVCNGKAGSVLGMCPKPVFVPKPKPERRDSGTDVADPNTITAAPAPASVSEPTLARPATPNPQRSASAMGGPQRPVSATLGPQRPASAMAGPSQIVDSTTTAAPRSRYWGGHMVDGLDCPPSRMQKVLGMARRLSVGGKK
jgi:hypothetical protein